MEVPIRNIKDSNAREVEHNRSIINAWVREYEEMNSSGIWETKKEIKCHIFREGSSNQPLNLGECNNGDKLTSVNQAVNQAKQFVNYLNK